MVIAGVCIESPTALLLFVIDGLPAVLILVAATLIGTRLARVLLGENVEFRWKLLVGVAFGLGVVSTGVLILGSLGLMQQTLWIVLLIILGSVGAWSFRHGGWRRPSQQIEQSSLRWLLLLVSPFLSLIVIVSVTPPGVLWQEEGSGYDVLEYHLELPREYLAAEQITSTPHNVYGHFPANAEMLYLLSMIVVDDVYAGAATAKILNALIGVGCLLAAFVIGRHYGKRVGIVSALLAGSTGWIVYLSGIAYVENLMLFFGFVATGALLRASDPEVTESQRRRWLTTSGLLAGFACGCKYTAIPMIAAPLVLLAASTRGTLAQRCRSAALVATGCLAAFSPWLVKNTVLTGNPVFPLASNVFASYPDGWGEAEARHFVDSHRPAPDESSIADRARLTWKRILADPNQRFGPVLFILAAWAMVFMRRSRLDVLLAGMLVLQFLAWVGLTHLYARFAVPLIIPLVLLGGRVARDRPSSRHTWTMTTIIVAGVIFNGYHMWGLYQQHFYHEGQRLAWEGATEFFTTGQGAGYEHLSVLNDASFPADAKVLMIGDAKAFYVQPDVDYCVVFNRNPFVTAIRNATSQADIMNWLTSQGYSHVLVNRAEISRLRRSRYGFPDEITPGMFDSLTPLGLEHIESFATGDPPTWYANLFTVNSISR